MVLIGTYRDGQFKKWKGYYNYPISDADKVEPEKINELWLFNGNKQQRTFTAEFVGVKTRKELVADYKYPAKGKAHGEKYLLFKIKRRLQPSKTADGYFIRTKDFAGRSPKIAAQLKAFLASPDRNDSALAAKLPRIVTKLPAAKLVVGEGALRASAWSPVIGVTRELEKIESIVMSVTEFGRNHSLTVAGAYDYLCAHAGMDFLDEHYSAARCYSADMIDESLSRVCRNHGGPLK